MHSYDNILSIYVHFSTRITSMKWNSKMWLGKKADNRNGFSVGPESAAAIGL